MSKVSSSSLSSSSSSSSQELGKNVILIAHRGRGPTSKLSGHPKTDVPEGQAPENTLKAFREAILQNADGIEFDIYLSKDNVPMVIHDDELNINIAGAKRNERELGLVSEKTVAELKARDETGKAKYNIGQGEMIPTQSETLELIGEANKDRKPKGLKNLVVNIELKGNDTPEPTHGVVKEYIGRGLIDYPDVIYCSFKHEELAALRNIDPRTQVAPGIKTAFLFGKENVDVNAGWIVPDGVKYKPESIAELDQLAKNLKPSMVAYDAVLWDIYQPLIDLAKRNDLAIHASTSDFRDFENADFIPFLKEAQKHVQVYFKTDEPQKVLELLSKEVVLDKQKLSEEIEIDIDNLIYSSNPSQSDLKRLKKPTQEVAPERKEEVKKSVTNMVERFTRREAPVERADINSGVNTVKKQDKAQGGMSK